MALTHSYSWQFPLNSDQFNRVVAAHIASGVYDGMLVTASTMNMAINVGPGRCLLPNGTTVWNDVTLINPAAAGFNSSSNIRIDAVVMEYIHGSDPDINRPRIKILAGDAAVLPVPPTTNSNQVVLAYITLNPGASSFNSAAITNVERVPQVSPGFLTYKHADGTTDTITSDKDSDGFISNADITVWNDLGASSILTASKLALEGIYPGSFSVSHTLNDYGKPESSLLIITPFTPTGWIGLDYNVTVTYEYYDDQWLKKRIMETSKYRLTETYTYQTPAGQSKNPLPNVVQTVVAL